MTTTLLERYRNEVANPINRSLENYCAWLISTLGAAPDSDVLMKASATSLIDLVTQLKIDSAEFESSNSKRMAGNIYELTLTLKIQLEHWETTVTEADARTSRDKVKKTHSSIIDGLRSYDRSFSWNGFAEWSEGARTHSDPLVP